MPRNNYALYNYTKVYDKKCYAIIGEYASLTYRKKFVRRVCI